MTYQAKDDWEGDRHRHVGGVHYRLYVGRDGATVICVQDFDYFDYDARRVLSPDAWDTEADAEHALAELLPAITVASIALPATLDSDMRMRMIASAVRSSRGLDTSGSAEIAAIIEDQQLPY